jgi:hypothetical protein
MMGNAAKPQFALGGLLVCVLFMCVTFALWRYTYELPAGLTLVFACIPCVGGAIGAILGSRTGYMRTALEYAILGFVISALLVVGIVWFFMLLMLVLLIFLQ